LPGTGGSGAPVGAYAGLAVIALIGLGSVLVVRRRRGDAARAGAGQDPQVLAGQPAPRPDEPAGHLD
jgi:LPXTG-motif cell wall-anchored protein